MNSYWTFLSDCMFNLFNKNIKDYFNCKLVVDEPFTYICFMKLWPFIVDTIICVSKTKFRLIKVDMTQVARHGIIKTGRAFITKDLAIIRTVLK